MRREPFPVRGILYLICAGLLGGCSTGERRANLSWNRIAEGMSKEDVVRLCGKADVTAQPGGGEVWHYSYGSRPDPEQIGVITGEVILVLTIVGAYFVLVALAGHGPDRDPDLKNAYPRVDSPNVTTSKVHFKVVFDGAGKVSSVSGVELCED